MHNMSNIKGANYSLIFPKGSGNYEDLDKIYACNIIPEFHSSPLDYTY